MSRVIGCEIFLFRTLSRHRNDKLARGGERRESFKLLCNKGSFVTEIFRTYKRHREEKKKQPNYVDKKIDGKFMTFRSCEKYFSRKRVVYAKRAWKWEREEPAIQEISQRLPPARVFRVCRRRREM